MNKYTISSYLFWIAVLFCCLLPFTENLTIGTTNQNNLIPFSVIIDGSVHNTKLVLDGNWHWVHSAQDMSRNCFPTDTWDTSICPDPQTCWNTCAIEGIPSDQWSGNYGVHV